MENACGVMATVERLEPRPAPGLLARRDRVLSALGAACARVAGCPIPLHLFGSARLGVESPRNDIDLLALIPLAESRAHFLRKVGEELGNQAQFVRLVDVGTFAFLHVEMETVRLELQAARTPGGEAPSLRDQAQVDPESWVALTACLEADRILEAGERRVGRAAFLAVLRAMRAWGHARALTGNAWGLLANFSWAILVAWAARKSEATSVEELLDHVFSTISRHDWSMPVTLGDAPPGAVERPLTILTALPPYRNTTYNLTKCTTQLMFDELHRAAQLARRGEWEALFAPAPLVDQSRVLLVLAGRAPDRLLLEECRGALKEAMARFLLEVEALAPIRPWPEARMGTGTCEMVVGLGPGEHMAALSLAEAFGGRIQALLPGVTMAPRIEPAPRVFLGSGPWPEGAVRN